MEKSQLSEHMLKKNTSMEGFKGTNIHETSIFPRQNPMVSGYRFSHPLNHRLPRCSGSRVLLLDHTVMALPRQHPNFAFRQDAGSGGQETIPGGVRSTSLASPSHRDVVLLGFSVVKASPALKGYLMLPRKLTNFKKMMPHDVA